MVRKLSGILALCAIGAFWTTQANAQYCNTATTNVAITPTTISQNTASYSGGRRAFSFATTAGRTYLFATCGLSTADTYLRLYSTGTGGTLLASGDDNCGTQSSISYTETVSTTRSVLVTNYSCAALSVATQVSYYYTGGGGPPTGCFSAPNGEYPTGPITPTCNGVANDVAQACGYAGEYTTLNLTAGVNYIFTSGISSDWITISNNTGTVGYVFGTGPVNYTPTTTTTYRFYTHVSSACGAQSACRTRNVQCAAGAPANDLVCNAQSVACGSTTSGTTVLATNTGTYEGVTTCNNSQSMPAVWYSIGGTGTALTASLCGTAAWDSRLSVYSGTCTSLTCIGGNDDNGPSCTGLPASFTWPTTLGVTYFIKAYGYNTNSAFSLSVTCAPPPPPANDACANAIDVNNYPYTSPVISTAAATDDFTTSTCDGPYKNIWWRVSGVCGAMTVSTCNTGTNFDTELTVFSGACGSLTQVGCNDDVSCPVNGNSSSVTWTATQGTFYYISAGSYFTGGATGNIVLSVTSTDGDGDGVGDVCDNCVSTSNPAQANADGDVAGDACDLCPNDPNKIAPGICGCGVSDVDTDGDLTADCNDACPNDPNKIAPGICGCGVADTDTDGDLTADCNDACPNDPNKIAPGICGCGVADVPVTYYADTDGDGFGDSGASLAGYTCIVPPGYVTDNTDCDDSQFLYADTDGDGFGAGAPAACGVSNNTDDCPTVVGLVGSNCDAQPGPGFALGQLNGACTCVAVPCTENVVVELRTDANSNEAGWEILDQNTTLVICSGGYPDSPYPNNITNPITENCCLPNGCYRIRVLDAGGDGFVSGGFTGGYQLRESGTNGRRIIDNFENFSNGSVSAVSSTYENGAFCVPISDDELIFSSCDKLDWVDYKYLVTHANAAVSAEWVPSGPNNVQDANSGYEFWIFDPNGSYSYRRFHAHNVSDGFSPASATRAARIKINGWYNSPSTPLIPQNTLLNVRVRARVNGVNGAFGPACKMKLDAARAACPVVKLQDDPANPSDYSCGVTRTFGGTNTASNKITALPPQFSPAPYGGGTGVRFQFRFRIPAEGVCIVRPPQASPTLYLNWSAAQGEQLQATKTYEVEVRVSKDLGATWCIDAPSPACDPSPVTTWGKACNVTISNVVNAQGGSSSMTTQGSGALTLYPNPNNGDQLFINLSEVDSEVNTVSVDIFDLAGKRISARTIAVNDGFVKTNIDLNGELSNGLYMVNITAGEKTYNERLVIQK